MASEILRRPAGEVHDEIERRIVQLCTPQRPHHAALRLVSKDD
jgi:hypothetical protein